MDIVRNMMNVYNGCVNALVNKMFYKLNILVFKIIYVTKYLNAKSKLFKWFRFWYIKHNKNLYFFSEVD